jgi:hypothetical protein
MSTAMQIGSHDPVGDSRIASPLWAFTVEICANGMPVMASTWPANSAFTWADESGKSMTVTWSK